MRTDRATVNLVVGLLGLVALGALGALVALALADKLTDNLTVGLFGTTTGAVGLIGGLLANPQSVDVDGLQAIHDAQEESFLPQLQAQIDAARSDGHEAGAQAALRSIGSVLHGPAPALTRVGAPVVGAQVDEPVAEDLDDPDEPPDPLDVGPVAADHDVAASDMSDDEDPLAAPAR